MINSIKKGFLLFGVVIISVSPVQSVEILSKWDIALPAMQINNVNIHETSLESAWQQISTQFNLRTNLIVESTNEKHPFGFNAETCTGEDLLDALIGMYKDYTWVQDAQTGVIWVCPKENLNNSILQTSVVVPADQWGVPMQTGILEPFADISGGTIRVQRGGMPYTNTFNYPVDIPKGTYKVRDLLNICCVADPSKSFYIRVYPTHIIIQAYNLFSMHLAEPPAGAVLFWKTEIGNSKETFPSEEEIIEKLASPDSRIRWAARGYLGSVRISPEKLILKSQPGEQALWVCLGTSNIYSRLGKSTRMPLAVERMQKELTEEFLMQGNSEVAVIAAMALAKLNSDANALSVLARKESGTGNLSSVISEINYLVRTSQQLRGTLQVTGTTWLSTATPALRDIAGISEQAEMIFKSGEK